MQPCESAELKNCTTDQLKPGQKQLQLLKLQAHAIAPVQLAQLQFMHKYCKYSDNCNWLFTALALVNRCNYICTTCLACSTEPALKDQHGHKWNQD
mmetsp:Transcript_20996/g.36040  ORF Transcript_20996/g.36040 Transcript_20996/m.36040 type:complete len:96 (-) Transcript_20996:92-379(-)